MPKNYCIMQIRAESGKSALPICNYSQILYQFLTFTQNLKRSLGIGVSYVKHSNSELVMTSVNGLKSLNVKVYYISNRAIPSPSSFLKSVDFTIASGTATKNILLSDITDAGEIVCAGLVSRGWEGWNALNVTYTTESVTITFSTSNNSGNAYGSEIVRVWYR